MIWQIRRKLMLTGAALAAFFMALVKAFTLGKKLEQQNRTEKTLNSAATRLEIENEVNQNNDTDVRTELSGWLRDK